MTPRTKLFTFSLPLELKQGLQAVKARDGVAEAEQIRRGILMWLESRGVVPGAETERKRPASRKRS